MADTTNALALSDEDFMALNDAPVSQEPSASTETETSGLILMIGLVTLSCQ